MAHDCDFLKERLYWISLKLTPPSWLFYRIVQEKNIITVNRNEKLEESIHLILNHNLFEKVYFLGF